MSGQVPVTAPIVLGNYECTFIWKGILDLNQCMSESKSDALPTWLIPYTTSKFLKSEIKNPRLFRPGVCVSYRLLYFYPQTPSLGIPVFSARKESCQLLYEQGILAWWTRLRVVFIIPVYSIPLFNAKVFFDQVYVRVRISLCDVKRFHNLTHYKRFSLFFVF